MYTTYDECYNAGSTDYAMGSRQNAPICVNRGGYEEGYHDARRAEDDRRYYDNLGCKNDRRRSEETIRRLERRYDGIPNTTKGDWGGG
jgi:hypothetical protein